MSDGRNPLRSMLDNALTVAAIAASLLAVVVVIALVWWVRSLSPAPPSEVLLPGVPAPAPRQAAAPPRTVPPPPRPAAPPVQRAAAPLAPAPTAVPSAAPEGRGGNDDAAKNRALGAALSRLGDDPELQRRLRESGIKVPP
jgi:hypothetical protein